MKILKFVGGILLLLFTSACFDNSSGLSTHLKKSIDYHIQAAQISNSGSAFQTISPDNMQEIMRLEKLALKEAKAVDIDKLNRDYPDFGTNYSRYFIEGLDSYITGVEKDNGQKVLAGQVLIETWGNWYSENLSNIKNIKRHP